jgi:hypothetical protein
VLWYGLQGGIEPPRNSKHSKKNEEKLTQNAQKLVKLLVKGGEGKWMMNNQ